MKHADETYPRKEYGQANPYIHMEVGLPRGADDALQYARVKRRAVGNDGIPIGCLHSNPLLDTRQYEVEFKDGSMETLSANIIAENLLAQVDEEGQRQMLLSEIVDHRVLPDAVPKEKGEFKTPHGTVRKKMTTRGWELCVKWKDGSTDWVQLKDLKDLYPIKLAEYAICNRIDQELAFAWWVKHTLKSLIALFLR